MPYATLEARKFQAPLEPFVTLARGRFISNTQARLVKELGQEKKHELPQRY
jgi:hypothetical protein